LGQFYVIISIRFATVSKYYGVNLVKWNKIDIAVDRNVARVFLRTGLIPAERGKKNYPVREIKNTIIQKARDLYPKFPGALDEPVYEIGKYWCKKEEAYCDYEGEPCPLTKVCTKRKRDYQVH
jgi:adenine-specific DNA glycosylase